MDWDDGPVEVNRYLEEAGPTKCMNRDRKVMPDIGNLDTG